MTKTNTVQDARQRQVVAATTLPLPIRDSIDALAAVRLLDRSAYIREVLVERLEREGVDIASVLRFSA